MTGARTSSRLETTHRERQIGHLIDDKDCDVFIAEIRQGIEQLSHHRWRQDLGNQATLSHAPHPPGDTAKNGSMGRGVNGPYREAG